MWYGGRPAIPTCPAGQIFSNPRHEAFGPEARPARWVGPHTISDSSYMIFYTCSP